MKSDFGGKRVSFTLYMWWAGHSVQSGFELGKCENKP